MTMFNSNKQPINDITFLGIACDFGSSGVKGCKSSPEVIRHLSQMSGTSNEIIDISTGKLLFNSDKLSDLGIIKYDCSKSTESFLSGIQLLAETIFGNSILFSIGGDHLISYPLIKATLNKIGKIQVLHYDAHFDLNKIPENSIPSHNNFVSFLCKEENLEKWIAVGQRGLARNSQNSHPKVIHSSAHLCTDHLDKSVPLYITIDLDAIDLSEFQAVSFPQPGQGVMLTQILENIKTLKSTGYQIKGIDICEYNSKLDTETYLYGRVLVNFIALILSILQTGTNNE